MFPEQYQSPKKIAQGGSAEVYRARVANDLGFERTVAIKRILPEHRGDRVHEAMFVNEANLLVTLNHPNIVRVFDLGIQEGALFLIMEYVDGCDLRSIMQWYARRNRRIPLECAILLVAEIAKALDYAHTKKGPQGRPLEIIHLDVSPRNILLSLQGQVKLTDFGISAFCKHPGAWRPVAKGREERVVRGKLNYMSPEQALGYPLDFRSDIFSLGLVFYELVTGSRLYHCADLSTLQREHRERRTQAPLFPSDIPEELEFYALRALQFEPQRRYASAGDFSQDLFHFLYENFGTFSSHQLAFVMEEWKAHAMATGTSFLTTDETPTQSAGF